MGNLSAMSSDTIFSLLLGIPIAFYCSAVYGRISHFSELKREVLRIIRTVDFMQEENGVVITKDEEIPKLTLIVSELLFLKHRKAAEDVSRICSDFHEVSMHARVGRLDVLAFGQSYSNWQSAINNLPPNRIAFWSPWSKL